MGSGYPITRVTRVTSNVIEDHLFIARNSYGRMDELEPSVIMVPIIMLKGKDRGFWGR